MSSAEPTGGARRNRGLTTVKVDAETHRLIGDLAHLLERTRGEVVRDAVNAFAVWRETLLDHGADESAQRVALANARHQARLASGDLATSDAEHRGVERPTAVAARPRRDRDDQVSRSRTASPHSKPQSRQSKIGASA